MIAVHTAANTGCMRKPLTASANTHAAGSLPGSVSGGRGTPALSGGGVCCNSVAHVAKFSVDRRGIEGAAATVADMGPTAADPGEYEKKYYDFIVKRAFGYAVTSPCGAVLFTGIVNNV